LTETLSVDYTTRIKAPVYDTYPMPLAQDTLGGTTTTTTPAIIDPWVFQSLMPRVGYNGTTYYMINTQFAHFFTKADTTGKKIDWK